MEQALNMNSPLRAAILKVLTMDPKEYPILGRSADKDVFFQDLISIGVDFYELLELYISRDAVTANAAACIVDNIPDAKLITNLSENTLKKMIPHWTASKYHTAKISSVLQEIRKLIAEAEIGTYIYNSNQNRNNLRSYNDIYLLIVTEYNAVFFDINRKKAFCIVNKGEIK